MISAKSITIYALVDPRTNEVKYVGKTCQNINIRLSSHMRDRRPSKKTNWIKSLSALGMKPVPLILESINCSAEHKEWEESERFWISYLRFIGAKLTNLTDGGEGFHGLIFTETHKKKIGDAHRGRTRSNEMLARMSESRKGIPVGHLLAYSKSMIGKKLSPEHRAKIAEGGRGKTHSMETRLKMSIAATGRKVSAEGRKNMSKAQLLRTEEHQRKIVESRRANKIARSNKNAA